MTEPLNFNNNMYFKIGNEVPEDDVNVSYFETPAVTQDNLSLINTYSNENIFKTSIKKFVPDKNHILWTHPDRSQNYINTDKFVITNLTTADNNLDGSPLFYQYTTRYLHKKIGNNIENDITILDKNKNTVAKDNAPYILETRLIDAEKMLYEITLLLSDIFTNTFYIKYNPASNPDTLESVNLPDRYMETINIYPIFERVDMDTFNANTPDLDGRFYTVQEDRGVQYNDGDTKNYKVYVPGDSILEADYISSSNQNEYNVDYNYAPARSLKYRTYYKGFSPNATNGLYIYFLYDHSGSMDGHFSVMNNAIADCINTIDQDVANNNASFTPKYNVLYYTYASATYFGVYGSDEPVFEWEIDSGNVYSGSDILSGGLRGGNNSIDSDMTNVYDAYVKAVKNMMALSPSDGSVRKVIITMSDGMDNESSHSASSAANWRETAFKNGIESYSVGFDSGSGFNSSDMKSQMLYICDGEENYFEGADLSAIYNSIASEVAIQKVYAPIIPGGSGLVDNKAELPALKTDWVKTTERQIIKDIPLQNHGLIDEAIYLDFEKPTDCIDYVRFKVNDSVYYDGTEDPDTGIYIGVDATDSDKISIVSKSHCEEHVYSRVYFIKPIQSQNTDKVNVKLSEDNPDNNWYLEVSDGSFERIKTVDTADGTKELKYIYEINEYSQQEFDDILGEPYKKVANEQPYIIDKYSVKLSKNPLYAQKTTQNGYIVPDLITNTDNIVIDWNSKEGLLTFLNEVPEDIEISYTYQDHWYQYRGYFKNFSDNNGDQRFLALDVNPTLGHYYDWIDDSTKKTEMSSTLPGKIVYLYLRPSYVKENINGQFVNIPGSRRQNTLFHTVGKKLSGLSDPFFDRHEHEHIELDDIILLAKLYINPVINTDLFTNVDTRSRGGGVKPEQLVKLKDIHPEINAYWDLAPWNGEPYPKNSVAVIEVPISVLDTLTHSAVKEKIEKHLAYGVLPIIRYV